MDQHQQPTTRSVLGTLRSLIPTHGRIPFAESLRIAERQANRLLKLHGITAGPVPTEIISDLPKITVEYIGQLFWGASFWDANRQVWVIQLSRAESPTRIRYTLAHEFKHIIDHGRQAMLYRGTRRTSPDAQAEQVADYFADCLLVPRTFLKTLWDNGIRTTGELADTFQVSETTIGRRLTQTGLVEHHHLRHLPAPLPFIADNEVELPPPDTRSDSAEEGALPA
ncbi:ImmA/IrrE family metallo-endopeptidase [Mycolicibacterium wolinskyi]|uniref:Zn peptidase n=1 Tax=Mycolicibacterium wolinskyi TaxID=59750 RepID=A0A1X2F9J3_9MYCO|nr:MULTISPECIES: ImmA/IrrE family metallo-endopeptidase [Mycolicibacterium]MCV7286735.1 ImmA/IrrE family metallo-endopeptidase [Mycolicibacterium wolinskyi]MCV7293715.1 ImmA/IrrE family metallo-endopeptidase [Mycolicibacterium goodii]ORX15077.1 Zn peptidase [Mycolicibacterium wolinskyi]